MKNPTTTVKLRKGKTLSDAGIDRNKLVAALRDLETQIEVKEIQFGDINSVTIKVTF